MKRALVTIVGMIAFAVLPIFAREAGTLFIIGGGERPPEMMRRFVSLCANVKSGKIVVFPMASSEARATGEEQAEELRSLGAAGAESYVLNREQAFLPESCALLEDIGGVFFSGGDQSRLAAVLVDTPVHKKLLSIYREGAVIGGTSAGAAVMSRIMITGDEKKPPREDDAFQVLWGDNIVTTPGFGFLEDVIIDQHFIRRKRHNRLISLVLEHPGNIGVGIDEATAVIVTGGKSFEVTGRSGVIVYDASKAVVSPILPEGNLGGRGIVMHVLRDGDRYDLAEGEVPR